MSAGRERAVTLCVRALAVAVVSLPVLTLSLLSSPALRTSLARLYSASGYARGQLIDLPRGVFEPSEVTIVIFARNSCPGCQAAKGSLARLSDSAKSVRGVRVVLVVPAGSSPSEQQFASEIGIRDASHVIQIAKSRVTAIPAIVIVDRTGRILFASEGSFQPREVPDLKDVIANAAVR